MLSGLITESGFTPRSNRPRHTDGGLSFAAAVRVVARVHDDAADGRTDTEISRFARFADSHDFVF